jgi:hypothetical protein
MVSRYGLKAGFRSHRSRIRIHYFIKKRSDSKSLKGALLSENKKMLEIKVFDDILTVLFQNYCAAFTPASGCVSSTDLGNSMRSGSAILAKSYNHGIPIRTRQLQFRNCGIYFFNSRFMQKSVFISSFDNFILLRIRFSIPD